MECELQEHGWTSTCMQEFWFVWAKEMCGDTRVRLDK